MSKALADLNASFVGAGGSGVTLNGQPMPERSGIGVALDCPCGCDNRFVVQFANPLDGGPPLADGRNLWQRTGDTLETLTLSPSVQRVPMPRGDGMSCSWHGWIRDGAAVEA